MPNCPQCISPLRTMRQREGIYFHCPSCEGRAVTVPQIRRVAGDRFATGLLRQINANPNTGPWPCPFCEKRMRVFRSQDPPLELDACRFCGAVWFDPAEFQAIPQGALESMEELRLRGVEAMATHRLEEVRQRQLNEVVDDLLFDSWKTVPALFGFPVETDVDEVPRWPLATWTLAALIALVSCLGFFNLQDAVQRFGMIPAEGWRYGGLTLITSFFLHGGPMHLIGNLYFLLVFGDNVEDYLGRWRYLLLIFLSTVAGDLVHLIAQPASTIPCIGASGGISGVIVFYGLKFPRAQLGILFQYWYRFRWVHFPAWSALVIWMALQGIGAALQRAGSGGIAFTAHLGGAAMGLAMWWLWRRR